MKRTTLFSVLSLVAKEDMDILQLDVKIAFLHGDLHAAARGIHTKGQRKACFVSLRRACMA